MEKATATITRSETPTLLESVIKRGIPVWKADFHSAVNNSDETPENFFSQKSTHKSRNVEMWWVPGDGLYCKHKDQLFGVPTSTVKKVYFT